MNDPYSQKLETVYYSYIFIQFDDPNLTKIGTLKSLKFKTSVLRKISLILNLVSTQNHKLGENTMENQAL